MHTLKKGLALTFCLVGLMLAFAPPASAQRNTDPAQFLAAHEPELQQPIRDSRKLFLLTILAPAALAAKDFTKARNYANELMALGQSLQNSPGFGPSFYGDATHVGNIVLGQIALQDGDLRSAKEHLFAAARIPGSPTLNSFGPDMKLAEELIEKREPDAATAYFDLCAKFWVNDQGKLQQWKDAVTRGSMPNFGPNLGYILDKWRYAHW